MDGVTTNYTLDLNSSLIQVLADDAYTYLYGAGRIAQVSSTASEYFLGDALNSVRQLVDGEGNPLLSMSYDPFGSGLGSMGVGSSVVGYTGEITDPSGLVYLRARYYAPGAGSFISRDSWEGNQLKPRTYNLWSYVLSNPINLTDPSGNICMDPWAPSGIHFDPNRGCDYPEGSTGVFWWRKDPLGPDTAIIDMPWVDEMDQTMWNKYPNSCGAAALYMFLGGEGVSVNFETLVQQLQAERPGGYDSYCCSSGWGVFPTPTPGVDGWCNRACVSGEALANVARKHYGLDIVSGDNWTHQNVYNKVSQGHPVLTLIRSEVTTNPNYFGHFVAIRGFTDRGWTVVFNDSYPGEAYWNGSASERRKVGEKRGIDWNIFDASWASNVDVMDPLSPGGHVRWAMAVR
jgi:RHS repeat-associated protein